MNDVAIDKETNISVIHIETNIYKPCVGVINTILC